MKVLDFNALKYFYSKIKTSITSLTSRVSALEKWKQSVLEDMTYSYAETKTGSTWVDGKPIYRRVFKVTNKSLSNGTMVQSFAKSNFDTMIDTRSFLQGSDGGLVPFPRVGSSGKGSGIEYSSSNNGFMFMGNDSWVAQSSRWLMIIAEYTK